MFSTKRRISKILIGIPLRVLINYYSNGYFKLGYATEVLCISYKEDVIYYKSGFFKFIMNLVLILFQKIILFCLFCNVVLNLYYYELNMQFLGHYMDTSTLFAWLFIQLLLKYICERDFLSLTEYVITSLLKEIYIFHSAEVALSNFCMFNNYEKKSLSDLLYVSKFSRKIVEEEEEEIDENLDSTPLDDYGSMKIRKNYAGKYIYVKNNRSSSFMTSIISILTNNKLFSIIKRTVGNPDRANSVGIGNFNSFRSYETNFSKSNDNVTIDGKIPSDSIPKESNKQDMTKIFDQFEILDISAEERAQFLDRRLINNKNFILLSILLVIALLISNYSIFDEL